MDEQLLYQEDPLRLEFEAQVREQVGAAWRSPRADPGAHLFLPDRRRAGARYRQHRSGAGPGCLQAR